MSTPHQHPLTKLKGIGPSLAEKLRRIGINNLLDLLFHLPLRYQDRTRLTPIGVLQNGSDVMIEGEVAASSVVFGRRRSLLVKLQDTTGTTTLRFFHFSKSQQDIFKRGQRVRCFGEARWGKNGLELNHPEYRLLYDKVPYPLEDHLTPIYPVTEGLQQQRLRKLIEQVFLVLENRQTLPDLLPAKLLSTLQFMPLLEALKVLHFPPTDVSFKLLDEGRHPAQLRLAFEEMLAYYLSMRRLRDQALALSAPTFRSSTELVPLFLQSLPFTATAAQVKVSAEISADLASGQPMLRLVQGDVGSGKTLVAVLAALQAIESGYQAVLMAPTEILAEQHFLTFSTWLQSLGISLGFLSSKVKGKKRASTLQNLASGETQLIIGTHALFQEEVSFHKLGLIIVDEQHRFGVHQRLSLREKGKHGYGCPHQLIMTATPIPRTLTMNAYADLDCSIIDELPPGRTPVTTLLLAEDRRPDIVTRIAAICAEGRQVYWVCTLIEESEKLQCQAAEATFEELHAVLGHVKVGLIHGRMNPQMKIEMMQRFKKGEIQLLVATTVIEVGVDVPNATLMVIENAERLGLAQLHQLRGRVGRGATASHCVLLYKAPLGHISKSRLEIIRSSNDGFHIAERDLEIRGPGEILGTRQTGLIQMRIADLVRDAHLQSKVKQWAEYIRQEEPELIEPLIQRWLSQAEQYGQV